MALKYTTTFAFVIILILYGTVLVVSYLGTSRTSELKVQFNALQKEVRELRDQVRGIRMGGSGSGGDFDENGERKSSLTNSSKRRELLNTLEGLPVSLPRTVNEVSDDLCLIWDFLRFFEIYGEIFVVF